MIFNCILSKLFVKKKRRKKPLEYQQQNMILVFAFLGISIQSITHIVIEWDVAQKRYESKIDLNIYY